MTMVRVCRYALLQAGECSLRTYAKGTILQLSRVDLEDTFRGAEQFAFFVDFGNQKRFGLLPSSADGNGTKILPERRMWMPRQVTGNISFADGRYRLAWSEADGMHIVDLRERIG